MSNVLLALILAVFTGFMIIGPSLSFNGFLYTPLVFGVVTGLIVGDAGAGLAVGANCALFALGFYTYGGATIPDYNIGAIYGTLVVVKSGATVEEGLIIATALALLMSLFDILGRATTTVFQHGGDRALAKRNIKSFERWHIAGTIPWILGRAIPTFIGVLFIDKYQYINDFLVKYAWVQSGLKVVGKSLSAVGFALLLSYMDIKRYWPFMLIGYVLFAYMGVPTIGLAIVGVCFGSLFAAGKKKEA